MLQFASSDLLSKPPFLLCCGLGDLELCHPSSSTVFLFFKNFAPSCPTTVSADPGRWLTSGPLKLLSDPLPVDKGRVSPAVLPALVKESAFTTAGVTRDDAEVAADKKRFLIKKSTAQKRKKGPFYSRVISTEYFR